MHLKTIARLAILDEGISGGIRGTIMSWSLRDGQLLNWKHTAVANAVLDAADCLTPEDAHRNALSELAATYDGCIGLSAGASNAA